MNHDGKFFFGDDSTFSKKISFLPSKKKKKEEKKRKGNSSRGQEPCKKIRHIYSLDGVQHVHRNMSIQS